MDKIEAMRVFINVAELSSFSKTADHLGLPKGSISNAIQQLENQFSTQFLYRTTRKVKLTEDGQNFYERCKDILAAIDDLEDIYRPSNAPLVGRIRVDMPSKLAKIFSVHDKFHRTLILSGFCLLKIAKISLNSSFFPKPIKR